MQPNVLVTGTPGVGKSSFCTEICRRTGLQHIEIGTLARERNLLDGMDEERGVPFIDEDKVKSS